MSLNPSLVLRTFFQVIDPLFYAEMMPVWCAFCGAGEKGDLFQGANQPPWVPLNRKRVQVRLAFAITHKISKQKPEVEQEKQCKTESERYGYNRGLFDLNRSRQYVEPVTGQKKV